MRTAIVVAAIVAQGACAFAAVRGEVVEYSHGDAALKGYIAYDDETEGERPGVLVFPEWWGLNEYVKGRARQLAQLGYVAFAADMYGEGRTASTREEASAMAGEARSDAKRLAERAQAALEALRKHPLTADDRIAAIGYCFGGSVALELARVGADISGVAAFHAGLKPAMPGYEGGIKAKVLVLHGADDPNVPAADVQAFEDEMRRGKADWYMVHFGGAVHSFTNPDAGSDPSSGAAYDERADKRSWEIMKAFLSEVFGGPLAGRAAKTPAAGKGAM